MHGLKSTHRFCLFPRNLSASWSRDKLHSRLGAGDEEKILTRDREEVSKDDRVDFFQLSEVLGVLR